QCMLPCLWGGSTASECGMTGLCGPPSPDALEMSSCLAAMCGDVCRPSMPPAIFGDPNLPDAPACVLLTPDAGPPPMMGGCLSVTNNCTQCADAHCCAQYDTCLFSSGGLPCNDEIAYWQGINPPPAEAYTDPAVMD